MDGLISVLNFIKSAEGASVVTACSTVVLTVTTIVYAYLTRALVNENKLLRKAGREPQVVAYLDSHETIRGAIQFKLANIGQGPALNVRFRIVEGGDDFGERAMFPRPTVPLAVLPQNERYESYLGIAHALFRAPRLKPFSVELTYSDLGGARHTAVYRLDISQFEGRGTIGNDPTAELVKAAKQIADELRSWSSRRLPVETMTRAERLKEDEEWRKQAESEL